MVGGAIGRAIDGWLWPLLRAPGAVAGFSISAFSISGMPVVAPAWAFVLMCA